MTVQHDFEQTLRKVPHLFLWEGEIRLMSSNCQNWNPGSSAQEALSPNYMNLNCLFFFKSLLMLIVPLSVSLDLPFPFGGLLAHHLVLFKKYFHGLKPGKVMQNHAKNDLISVTQPTQQYIHYNLTALVFFFRARVS